MRIREAAVGATLGVGLLAATAPAMAAEDDLIDPEAMAILTRMADHLAGAGSLRFETTALVDDVRDSGIKIKSAYDHEALLRRPASYQGVTRRDDGTGRRVWYDGETLVILETHTGDYAEHAFTGSLDQLLDHVIEDSELMIPIADLLYSRIDDTFAEHILSAEYVGERLVEGTPCHQISVESAGADWQLRIEADDTPVPRRFSIVYVDLPGEPEYLALLHDWEEAERAFRAALEQAVTAEPAHQRAWQQLGVVLFARQDLASATDALRQALRPDPADRSARRHLVLTLMARGRSVEAEAELNRLIEDDPADAESRTDLAILHLDRGAPEIAANLLAATTGDDRARYYRGLSLDLCGRREEARKILESLADGHGKYATKAFRYLQESA